MGEVLTFPCCPTCNRPYGTTGLTRRQKDCLAAIQRSVDAGISPSFDELREALGLSNKSSVHRLVISLEKRGFISRTPDTARSLAVEVRI